jgi:ribonucleoside-triphosphate reductase
MIFMDVIKRDGRRVQFNRQKIIAAIANAFLEQYGQDNITTDMMVCGKKIADEIEAISKTKELHVEEIQDIVERKLMGTRYKDVAKAYINYRYLHGLARDNYKDLMDAVADKLSAKNIQNQNANVDEASFGGRIGEASDVVTKKYALEYLVSPMARANHENNEIYIHDLNSYAVGSHNCLSIPFDDLLAKGFNTRQTDVRPAQSINTAFQLVAVIFQIQSLQQFGGVSATHLDWTMVPYMRKSFAKHYKDGLRYFRDIPGWEDIDYSIESMIKNAAEYSIIDSEWTAYCKKAAVYAYDMTERELVQAVEGMYHNLNTLQSRSGNQLPFSSINYGTCTLPEGRMVTKALIEASIKGVGKLRKTSIFPCGIFQCMKGVNRKPGDPNYDLFQLALKSTSLRLYPNYANVDWSGNAGYDINDPRTYFSTINKTVA